jgi:hypothetical protein
VAHRLPVRLAPHDDGDQRRLAHGAPIVSQDPATPCLRPARC